MIYITNAFSPSMLKLPSDVEFTEVDVVEFCDAVKKGVSAVGHQGTVQVINSLCRTSLSVNRVSLKADIGDQLYIFSLMIRLEEGRILSQEEVNDLLRQDKIKFVKATIYFPVLSDIVECYKRCDEREYDTLAFMARGW